MSTDIGDDSENLVIDETIHTQFTSKYVSHDGGQIKYFTVNHVSNRIHPKFQNSNRLVHVTTGELARSRFLLSEIFERNRGTVRHHLSTYL